MVLNATFCCFDAKSMLYYICFTKGVNFMLETLLLIISVLLKYFELILLNSSSLIFFRVVIVN